MINEILELAKAQPFLVGGVGTVLTSAGLYIIRDIPVRITRAIGRAMVSTIFVDTKNDYYEHISHQVWRYRIPWMFRSYEPADKDHEEFDTQVYLNPGYGSGWGIWKGTLFYFNKEKDEKSVYLEKKMFVRIYSRKIEKINQFVQEACFYQRGEPRQKVYVSAGTYFRRITDKKVRPLSTVFTNAGVVEKVLAGLRNFLDNEQFYIERGIPYKYCIMLYGPPGTGKTSLIHAIASHFQMDINYVTSLGSLGTLLGNRSNRQAITVIEDIDTLSAAKRDSEEENDEDEGMDDDDFTYRYYDKPPQISHFVDGKLVLPEGAALPPPPTRVKPKKDPSDSAMKDLHDALNSMDGFTSSHGQIMVITSNHPERLDHALMRPGRIDMGVEIGPLDFDAGGKMFIAFYGSAGMWLTLKDNYTPTVGAKLQQIFMENDAGGAVAALRGPV